MSDRPDDESLTGEVVAFDAHVGLGELRDGRGTAYLFHCAEIADGSRSIDIGARVRFVGLVKFGRIEAARLTPA